MKKIIVCTVSFLLAVAMLACFAGCDFSGNEGETTTTIKAKTPLPTDITTSLDENSSVVTDTEYTPEKLKENTATIFEYFNVHINELKDIKASVSMSRDKSVNRIEETKIVTDENGNETEETERLPYSDNDYVNIAIDSLKDYMLNEDGDEVEYGGDLKAFLPVKGEDFVSRLTLEDVESATCVDRDSERTITVTLKSPALPETLEKAYNMGNVDEVMKGFEEANQYMKVDKPVLTYDNCQIIIKADVETDEITSIEYIKNINVKTAVTGVGKLESIGNVPVQLCYRDSVRYSIDRTDPEAPTTMPQ